MPEAACSLAQKIHVDPGAMVRAAVRPALIGCVGIYREKGLCN